MTKCLLPSASMTIMLALASTHTNAQVGRSQVRVGPASTLATPALIAPRVTVTQSLEAVLALRDTDMVKAQNGQEMSVAQVRAVLNRPSEISATLTKFGGAKVPHVSNLIRVGGRRVNDPTTIASEVSLARSSRTLSEYLSCDGVAARLRLVRGEAKPGGVVTVIGDCLTAVKGELRLFGDFPRGVYQLPIHHWGDTSIVTQIPEDIVGVGAIPIRFEVITADRRAPAAVTTTFSPRMELVDVTALWRGDCLPTSSETRRTLCGNNSIDVLEWRGTGFSPVGQPPLQSSHNAKWNITIDRRCILGEAWANKGRGNVTKFVGWDDGPAHESNVRLTGAIEKWLDVSFWGDTQYGGFSTALGANAYCPVGVSPQP